LCRTSPHGDVRPTLLCVLAAAIVCILPPISYSDDFGQIGELIPKDGDVISPSSEKESSVGRVSNREAPGLMRIELQDVTVRGLPCSIIFHLPDRELEIAPVDLQRWLIYGNVIQIPVTVSGEVLVSACGDAPSIRYVGFVAVPPSGSPLFTVGDPHLRYIPQEFDPLKDKALLDLAKGVVGLWHVGPTIAGEHCTAFQFAPGFFLTNRHCIADDDGNLVPNSTIWLEYGSFERGLLDFEHRLPATLRARGGDQLDYAVLEADVPPDYQRAILKLVARTQDELYAAPELDVLTIWSKAIKTLREGKALSSDADCRIVPDATFACTSGSVKHRCDTEGGSSGSPVLGRGTMNVVALHFLGILENVGNCALPSDIILRDLRDRTDPDYVRLRKDLSSVGFEIGG
jgi:trypsin-like peptidase